MPCADLMNGACKSQVSTELRTCRAAPTRPWAGRRSRRRRLRQRCPRSMRAPAPHGPMPGRRCRPGLPALARSFSVSHADEPEHTVVYSCGTAHMRSVRITQQPRASVMMQLTGCCAESNRLCRTHAETALRSLLCQCLWLACQCPLRIHGQGASAGQSMGTAPSQDRLIYSSRPVLLVRLSGMRRSVAMPSSPSMSCAARGRSLACLFGCSAQPCFCMSG